MSAKFKRTFIIANTQHPDSLTDENFLPEGRFDC